MSESCKNAAHRYVRWFGWAVIPVHHIVEGPAGPACSCGKPNCPSPGKHPMTMGWTDMAATSGADVEEFWAQDPQANVGVLTGSVSGIWVLDVDTDKGGRESFARLCRDENGDLRLWQPMRSHSTGGGGFHLIFSLPAGVVVRSRTLKSIGYPGIDVRGDGGMVIVPPSVSGKGAYRW